MNIIYPILISAINKYKNEELDELNIQEILSSTISMITEEHLYEFRDFLEKQEGRLEYVNFMVDSKNRREFYLKVMSEIETFLSKQDRESTFE